MNQTKPKPTKPKIELREPAKPLAQPEIKPLDADHPAAVLFRPAIEQRAIVPPAIAPDTIVEPAIAQDEALLSHDAIVAQPAIAPSAIVSTQYTSVPNGIFDSVIPTLHVYDQSVLFRLFRLSRGYHSETCKVGYATLAKACNISTRQAQVSIERLIQAGWIERVGVEQGGSQRKERGSVYKMNLPAATIARPATIERGAIAQPATYKENIKKETNKREVVTSCEKCRETPGFLYPNGIGGGVIKCDHRI